MAGANISQAAAPYGFIDNPAMAMPIATVPQQQQQQDENTKAVNAS